MSAEDDSEPFVTVAQEDGHAGPWTARCTCGWSSARNSASRAQGDARMHDDNTGHDASNA